MFSKQTFTDVYTEMQVYISYFNQEAKLVIITSLTKAVLNWSPSCFVTAFSTAKLPSMLFGQQFQPILSYCFLNNLNMVTLCSSKTVHHAVYIEPRQYRMISETLFLSLQWKRRLAALQQSQNRIGTSSAHFQLTLVKAVDNFVFLHFA